MHSDPRELLGISKLQSIAVWSITFCILLSTTPFAGASFSIISLLVLELSCSDFVLQNKLCFPPQSSK